MTCTFCRGLQPAECPGCDNDNEPSIPEQDIVEEIFRDPGEAWQRVSYSRSAEQIELE